MPMRGLTAVVAEPNSARCRSALALALTHVAVGGEAVLFLDTAAVRILRQPIVDPEDARFVAAGLPTLAALFNEALDDGVRIVVCQTGVAMAGIDLATLDARIEAAGLVAIIASLGDDRLILG